MIRKFIITIAAITTFGCSSTYTHLEIQAPTAKLNPELGVLISTPEDGWFGDIEYKNSGKMTSNAVMTEFSKFAKRADVANDCEGIKCMNGIDVQEYGYFVEPMILHWEDRATEWSGRPDRIEISITIYDTASINEVAKSSFTGKSKWGTMGGDHPQDLLQEPTAKYVGSLYH